MKIEVIGKFTSLTETEIVNVSDSLAKEFSISDQAILEIYSATNSEIKKLNLTHRNKDEITDVLSFPIGGVATNEVILGTIVIDEEFSLKNNENVSELIKHGFLHLLGFDHETDQEDWNKAAKRINHNMF